MNNLRSDMPLEDWRGDVTAFAGFFDTMLADELAGGRVALVINFITPGDSPILTNDKTNAPYYVPCLLKTAPLTPKTAAKTGRTIGKQRSAAHMTHASFLVLDIDGMSQERFDALRDRLQAIGISFLVYSTFSHGYRDKPGVRARLVIPVDRPISPPEYSRAWLGFDAMVCDGAIAAKDSSGKAMHQQQGVWATAPERAHLAFKIVHRAGVASADALIAAAPVQVLTPRSVTRPVFGPGSFGTVERDKIASALKLIDPNDYAVWMTVGSCAKAIENCLGSSAHGLWHEFSERGNDAAKAKNGDKQYDPDTVFDALHPSMTADAALGTLMALAKKAAVELAVDGDRERALAALVHLRRFHPKTFEEMRGGC